MRAEIDRNGVLHVIPESESEAYALQKWRDDSAITIQFSDQNTLQMRGEKHWRAGALDFNPNWPRRVGDYT